MSGGRVEEAIRWYPGRMAPRVVTVRRRSLHDQDDPRAPYAHLTPADRVSLLGDLTATALAFLLRTSVEPRLQRNVVRMRRLRD